MLEWFEDTVDELHAIGVHRMFSVPLSFFIGTLLALYIEPLAVLLVGKWLLFLFPLWGVILAAVIWWHAWLSYVQSKNIAGINRTTVEIILPTSIEKTPSAMEYVFAGIHVHAPGGVFYNKWWLGTVHPYWGFEMHSYEGEIHFYVNCESGVVDLLRAQLYAQYPGIEVNEIRDPLSGFHFDASTMEAYATEFVKKGNGLPIKSYVDFEQVDVFTDITERTDPLCEMFEMLSSLGKGEQAYVQFVIRKDMQLRTIPHTWIPWDVMGGVYGYKTEKAIQKIYKKTALKYTGADGEVKEGGSQLKPIDITQIKALERNNEKSVFDVGVRTVYFSQQGKHDYKPRSTRFVHIFRQFHSDKYNSLKSGREYWHQPLDFPWQDYKNIRRKRFSRLVFDAMRRRMFFHAPYWHMHTKMTVEELATLYHLPSDECKAPGLARMQSKRGYAPENLPV